MLRVRTSYCEADIIDCPDFAATTTVSVTCDGAVKVVAPGTISVVRPVYGVIRWRTPSCLMRFRGHLMRMENGVYVSAASGEVSKFSGIPTISRGGQIHIPASWLPRAPLSAMSAEISTDAEIVHNDMVIVKPWSAVARGKSDLHYTQQGFRSRRYVPMNGRQFKLAEFQHKTAESPHGVFIFTRENSDG